MNPQNLVIVTGNLGADPERKVANQSSFTKLLLAQNVRRFNQEKKEFETVHTNWIRVVCFGQLAERVGTGLKKGSRVTVIGELRSSEYEAKDGGGKRKSVEIVASDVVRSEYVSAQYGVDLPDFDQFGETGVGPHVSL